MQKQQEWKIRKQLILTFPNCERAVDMLCQSTTFINGTRYRDAILTLSKTNHKLTKIFMTELTNHHVKINDKNWKIRFERLQSPTDEAKEDVKEGATEDAKEEDEEFVL